MCRVKECGGTANEAICKWIQETERTSEIAVNRMYPELGEGGTAQSDDEIDSETIRNGKRENKAYKIRDMRDGMTVVFKYKRATMVVKTRTAGQNIQQRGYRYRRKRWIMKQPRSVKQRVPDPVSH